MQETDTLLFEVLIDLPKVKENTEIALAALTRLRTEKEKTQKVFESNLLGEEVYRKTMQALQKEIDKTERELAGYTKIILDNENAQKSAKNIVQQMGSSLDALTPKVDAVAISQAQASAQIKLLNNELKIEETLAKSTGGSMEELDNLLADLTDQYRQLNKVQRDDATIGGVLLKQINEVTKAQEKNQKVMDDSKKGLIEYIRNVDILGINVGSTIDSFKSGAQGASLFSKAIFTGRNALIALGLVPIVAILTGLYIILTKSQKGMDLLEKATSAVSTVFSAFSNKVIAVGEALASAWGNPKQAIKDFGNFVETNLINRFKAFGVIIDGIRSKNWSKVADGVVQLGTGAEGAYSSLKKVAGQGIAIAEASQKIREEEIKLNTERARSEKFIERQKQISEDTTKSTEVRAAAARRAFAEGQKIQNSELALQKQRIQLAQMEAKAGQNTREQRLKISEEQAKYDEIEKNRIGERTELQNQLNSIEAEGTQKAEENAKKLAADRVAEAEAALVLVKSRGESTIEIEEEVLRRQIELIQKRAAAEKIGREVSVAQKKIITANAYAEELEAIKAHARQVEQRTFAIQESQLSAQLLLVQRGGKAEFDLQVKALAAQLDKEKASAFDSIKNKKQQRAELLRLDAKYNADLEELTLQFNLSQVTKAANLEALKIQTEEDANEVRLSDLRGLAADRIKLEEETQLKLLDIEKNAALEKVNPKDTSAREKVEEEFQIRRNAIEAKGEASRREINRQIDADEIKDAKFRSESRLALSKAGSKEELLARIDGINAERAAALNVAHQTADEKKAINDKANRDIEDAQKDFFKHQADQILDVFSQATSAVSTVVNAQIDNQLKALDEQQKAALSSAALSAEAREDIEKNFQKKREKLELEAAKKKKTIALIEATIGTAKAIVEAAPNPFLMALAAAVGALQIGVISSQKFAKGGVASIEGVVHGPSHAQGGIPMFHKSGRYVGEMEGEEIILTKGVYRNPVLRAQASTLNVLGGGRAFANERNQSTYKPARLALGGFLSPLLNSQSSPMNLDSINRLVTQAVVNGVAQAVSSMPAPVVGVKDIISGTEKRVRVQNRADS